MPPIKIIGFVFFCLIGVLSLWSIISASIRGIKSRSWACTTGRVKYFGFNYGVPSIAYDYTIDDRIFEGTKFTPGQIASNLKTGRFQVAKSLYLKADGSLRFPPDSVVSVFYDRTNPSDCALTRSIHLDSAKSFLILLPALLFSFALMHPDWMQSHPNILFPAVFFPAGVWMLSWGIQWLLRSKNSSAFPSVNGRLISAAVALNSGSSGTSGGGNGYIPVVDFEYRVNGALYRSQQLTQLPLWVAMSHFTDVQAFIDKLKSEPKLQVFYNPKAPWDGFLQRASASGVLTPMLLSLPCFAFGLFMAFRYAH